MALAPAFTALPVDDSDTFRLSPTSRKCAPVQWISKIAALESSGNGCQSAEGQRFHPLVKIDTLEKPLPPPNFLRGYTGHETP